MCAGLHVQGLALVFNTYRAHVLGAAEGAVQADAVLNRGQLSWGWSERMSNNAVTPPPSHRHPSLLTWDATSWSSRCRSKALRSTSCCFSRSSRGSMSSEESPLGFHGVIVVEANGQRNWRQNNHHTRLLILNSPPPRPP